MCNMIYIYICVCVCVYVCGSKWLINKVIYLNMVKCGYS